MWRGDEPRGDDVDWLNMRAEEWKTNSAKEEE